VESHLYNLNIERSVLSSILFDPAIYEDVAAVLKPSDFYHPFHQNLFAAMEELFREDQPIDEEFLKEKLTIKNQFDEHAFLEILAANPMSNTSAYVKEIKEKAIKRELVHLTTQIKKITVEQDLPVTDVIDEIQSKLYKITTQTSNQEFKDSAEVMKATLEHLLKMKERGNSILIGLDTGFRDLNVKTAGFSPGDLIIIAARPSMGKCLGKGTKVLMYDGTLKNVEDVVVGDLLMGDDSTPRRVLSIARGRERMYWVRQNKGIDYRVNESHILSLKRSRTEGAHRHGDLLNISVREFLQKSPKFQNNYKGYKVAVEFEAKDVPIEPYFLGLWLGDGRQSDVRITTCDKEVVEYLEKYAKRLGLGLKVYQDLGKAPVYAITGQKGASGSLQEKLRELGLLKRKHIPHLFLANSSEVRLELLAGLIDSDGHYDEQCGGYEIIQKSLELAKQIKFLCDTLGFRTSLIEKKVDYNDQKRSYYRVRFFGDVDRIPVRVERKKAKEWSCKRSWNQTGIKIEYDRVDDYYGFEIDGNRLFLLEDCTVTHNTAFSLNIAQSVLDQNKGVVIFSLEMPAEQLMMRMLSAKACIPLQRLRVGNLSDMEWSEISRLSDYYDKKKLFIDDEGSINVHQLRAKLRKLKSQHPEISLAIIDYLQLMSGSQSRDRHLEISEISRSLKMLARELDMPIIALSQLNRSLESRIDKRPMLSDLRESGAIEQDADVILFVYRDDVYKIKEAKQRMEEARKKGEKLDIQIEEKPVEEAEIIIGKQRNGPTGVVKLWFHKEYVKFAEEAAQTVREYEMKESNIDIPPI